MKIAFGSIDAIADTVARWKPDGVIAFHNPNFPPPFASPVPLLSIAFHDDERPRMGRTPPAHRHVAAIIAFINQHQPSRLMCVCTAGLSRSVAAAIVVAVHSGVEPEAACQAVLQACNRAQPNRLLLGWGDYVLDKVIAPVAMKTFDYRRDTEGAVTGDRVPFAELGELSR